MLLYCEPTEDRCNTWRRTHSSARERSECPPANASGPTASFAIIDCNAIIDCMASITIRNLEETTKRKLKVRAAINGRSMEQEAREILKSALGEDLKRRKKESNLVEASIAGLRGWAAWSWNLCHANSSRP